jgi:hypothetical protein
MDAWNGAVWGSSGGAARRAAPGRGPHPTAGADQRVGVGTIGPPGR